MLCKKTKGTITCVYASYNEVSGALERGCVQKRGQGTQACNTCAFAHWNSWYVYILKKNYCTWKSKLGLGQNRKLRTPKGKWRWERGSKIYHISVLLRSLWENMHSLAKSLSQNFCIRSQNLCIPLCLLTKTSKVLSVNAKFLWERKHSTS